MSASWKLSVEVAKPVAEAALAAQELAPDWDADIVLTACEIDEQHPDDWLFEAWLPRKPKAADRRAVAALFEDGAPDLVAEQVPETDWVTESQQRVPPIRAGRFHVHTPDYPPDPDAVDLVIPASQAFGTGQHATTAGCLEAAKIRGGQRRYLLVAKAPHLSQFCRRVGNEGRLVVLATVRHGGEIGRVGFHQQTV